jgi:hypothetical protein
MTELSIHNVDHVVLHAIQNFPAVTGGPAFSVRCLTVTDEEGKKVTLRLYASRPENLGIQEEYLP